MKKKLLNFVKSLFKVMDKKIVGTSQHYEMTDVNIYNSLKIYPKIIIDIGANVGDTVSEFRKSFSDSKIYAFEPDKNVFQRLSKRFKDDKNIFCYENAISNVEGDQDFYVSNEPNLLSSLLEKENKFKTLGLYDPEYSNVLDKGVFKVANAIFVNNTTFNNYLNS